MSRPLLSLYALDRDALKALSAELKETLAANDAAALAQLLELGDAARGAAESFDRTVDAFLVPDTHAQAKVLWASLRRIAKKRALTKIMTSDNPALEGRLRAYEPLRDDAAAAKLVDKLINPRRLPWYLRRPGATCGWLNGEQRQQLHTRLQKLAPTLTPELNALADALDEVEADAVLHDAL